MWILLSLLAVAVPVFAILRRDKNPVKRPYMYSCLSFALCAAVLGSELMSIKKCVLNVDFGSIEDTIGALIMVAVAISVVVVLANLLMMGLYYEKD